MISQPTTAAEDYDLESADEIAITLNGDWISADSPNVKVEGNIATISAAGTYLLSGTLGEGQIAVDSADKETVRLILNGVDIHNSSSAAINIINAEKVVILLADQSANRLSDGANLSLRRCADRRTQCHTL